MATPVIKVPRTKLSLRERFDVGNGFIPYLLILPTLLLILVVAVSPILDSFWLSLLDSLPTQGTKFIGLTNYVQLFTRSDFYSSMGTTLTFTTIAVTLEAVFGLLLALLLNDTFPGRSLLQASILIPWVFPSTIAAQMWSLMYNDRTGIISYILQQMHILAPGNTILETNSGIMLAAIIADVWKNTPFVAILLLAGLQVIPPEIYEAAVVDGSTPFQQFWAITLPLLNGPLTIALLFRTLTSLGVFDLFYILGGNQVQSMASFSYNYMFTRTTFDFAPGVAVAVLLFAIIVGQVAYRFSAMMIVLRGFLRKT